jgi:hypothetical protein
MRLNLGRIDRLATPVIDLDCDVSFFLPEDGPLRFASAPDELTLHLAFAVHRRPDDLRTHVRRILLLVQRGESDPLGTALADLFIVLGNRGLGLRRTLIDLAARTLTPTWTEFLTQHLARRLLPESSQPGHAVSLLAQETVGHFDMVRESR